MMAASKTYRTFITLASAAIGAELGIYLAGAHLVPAVDTAARTFDPPFALLWVAAGLVHACSAVAAGWIAAKAGWRIGRWPGEPAAATQVGDAEDTLFPDLGAVA